MTPQARIYFESSLGRWVVAFFCYKSGGDGSTWIRSNNVPAKEIPGGNQSIINGGCCQLKESKISILLCKSPLSSWHSVTGFIPVGRIERVVVGLGRICNLDYPVVV